MCPTQSEPEYIQTWLAAFVSSLCGPCTIPRLLHSGLTPELRVHSWASVNYLDCVGAPQKEAAEAGLCHKTALPMLSEAGGGAGKMQREQ